MCRKACSERHTYKGACDLAPYRPRSWWPLAVAGMTAMLTGGGMLSGWAYWGHNDIPAAPWFLGWGLWAVGAVAAVTGLTVETFRGGRR